MKDGFQHKSGYNKAAPAKESYKTVICLFEGKEVSYSFAPAEYDRVYAEYSKRGGPVAFTSITPAATGLKLMYIEKNGYWKVRR